MLPLTVCFLAERTFEDHENLVEPLLAWTRDSENKILFQERPGKNEVFKNPQVGPLIECSFIYLSDRTLRDSEVIFPISNIGHSFFPGLDLCKSISSTTSGYFH